MSWGFIQPWTKDPFNKSIPRPFNARLKTITEKKFFRDNWRYKRCLIPATVFFEKGFRIRKKNYETFWLGGIWSRWFSPDGAEIDSCCILTTEANALVRPLHRRMPVIITDGIENKWTENIKDINELEVLIPIISEWSSYNWLVEDLNESQINQIKLFKYKQLNY